MSGVKITLLIVAVFVTFMVGSFIWFVATWDAEKEKPVSFSPTALRILT